MKKFYVAIPTDIRWNKIDFKIVGSYNGNTYVETKDNIQWTPPVQLPREFIEEKKSELLKSKSDFLNLVDNYMNEKAKEKGYDNIVTAVSYSSFPNTFYDESVKFFKWRTQVYEWGYSILSKIQEGDLGILTKTIAEILVDIPKFEDIK